jgi:hypothetical protein
VLVEHANRAVGNPHGHRSLEESHHLLGRSRGGEVDIRLQVAEQEVADGATDAPRLVAGVLGSRKADLMAKVRKEKAVNDALAAELKAAIGEFKQTYK